MKTTILALIITLSAVLSSAHAFEVWEPPVSEAEARDYYVVERDLSHPVTPSAARYSDRDADYRYEDYHNDSNYRSDKAKFQTMMNDYNDGREYPGPQEPQLDHSMDWRTRIQLREIRDQY